MFVSYFGELFAELLPVFPGVLLRVSELNMIRIDELYWKTLKAIRYSFTGAEGIIVRTLVVFYHTKDALKTTLCTPPLFKGGLSSFFSLDLIISGNY